MGSKAGWAIFVGCMFVGMGIGMIFDQTGAGTLLGMGVGFILAALLGGEGKDVKIRIHGVHSIGAIIGILIGIGFILFGLELLGVIKIFEILIMMFKMLAGLFFIIIGLLIIIAVLASLKHK